MIRNTIKTANGLVTSIWAIRMIRRAALEAILCHGFGERRP